MLVVHHSDSMEALSTLNTHGRPIILIGLMGCGKTTVGKELSKQTGMPLLDMDMVIEEQIGKPIADIFRDEGEAHFRALETALLRYLETDAGAAFCKNSIISTGGGVVMRPENREILRRLGFTVWLSVDVDILISRTSRNNNRPLLRQPNREEILTNLLALRGPLYQETAHLTLDSSDLDIPAVVRAVHLAAQDYFSTVD